MELIIQKIRDHLSDVSRENGKVLYSSIHTVRKGDLYILGLNPGGKHYSPLSEDINKLAETSTNAYLDELWMNRRGAYPEGSHPLQKNVVGLLRSLGYDPRNVFCSNLIFMRSRDASGCRFKEYADICWGIHQLILEIVDPNKIVVFGNSGISPYTYIRNRYNLKETETFPSGHGNWVCLKAQGTIEGRNRILIGVPHLSRYAILNHPNVILWIRYSG